jgi:hypothetical protein
MFLLRNVPLRRLPIVTNLVENGKEVRRPEMFISGITILASTGIVMDVSLAVGDVMSVLPARMIRPMGFASISGMCVELVELITVRGTVLGRRGNEELTKSSLLLRLLLVRRERRGW